MRKWQKIDTAPRDGTKVDLWMVDQDGEGWREPDAYWVADRPCELLDFSRNPKTRDGWYAPHKDYDDQAGWRHSPIYRPSPSALA